MSNEMIIILDVPSFVPLPDLPNLKLIHGLLSEVSVCL